MNLEAELFLGFPVDELYSNQLKSINPHIKSQFIQEGDVYLQEIVHQEMRYIGKFVGNIVEYKQLELLETNIYSILKRVVADFPYEETPLYLFPVSRCIP